MEAILLSTGSAGSGGTSDLMTWLPMIAIMGLMFFFMNRSNKKKEREARELRESLEVGDEIVSIGGIVARVVKLEEETILVESGSDRSKLRLKREAIGTNNSSIERAEEAKNKAKEESASAKAAKSKK